MAGRSGAVRKRRHISSMAARTEHSMHLSGASCRYRGNSDGASFRPLPRRSVPPRDVAWRNHGNVAFRCADGSARFSPASGSMRRLMGIHTLTMRSIWAMDGQHDMLMPLIGHALVSYKGGGHRVGPRSWCWAREALLDQVVQFGGPK